MITPTGRAVEITNGGTRAVIGSVAAVLRSLTVDGIRLNEPIADDERPGYANGIVLAPWPNRVADARWTYAGEPQRLAVTEPDRMNALHGLLRWADYEVRQRTPDAVVLGAIIPPQEGWPFLLDTWVEYRALPDGLAVRHGVRNRSAERAPYGTGAHAYLRVGDAPVEDLVVTLHADGFIETDERLNPVAEHDVDGTIYDLRPGVRVGDIGGRLDTAFTRVRHRPGGEVARLTDPSTGRSLVLAQDADWHYAQVFTPTDFPAATGPRQAITIEPMTAPPNALNTGEGLIWLEPGEEWSGGWELRLAVR